MFYQMFPRLRSVQISSECKNYKSVKGVVFNKMGTNLIAYPVQKEDSSYQIPDSAKNIEWTAFADSRKLKTLIINKNLEADGNTSFKDHWKCK